MEEQGNTDVAALAASTMAVAISMTLSEGAWSSINAIVGISVVSLLLGYSWRHRRGRFEQFGYAAAISLAALPIIAFVAELWGVRELCSVPAESILVFIPYIEPAVCLEHFHQSVEGREYPNGTVSNSLLINIFIGLWFAAYMLDTRNQKAAKRAK